MNKLLLDSFKLFFGLTNKPNNKTSASKVNNLVNKMIKKSNEFSSKQEDAIKLDLIDFSNSVKRVDIEVLDPEITTEELEETMPNIIMLIKTKEPDYINNDIDKNGKKYQELVWKTPQFIIKQKIFDLSNIAEKDNKSLQEQLDEAIENEDFKLAAFLRDEIKKQENENIN